MSLLSYFFSNNGIQVSFFSLSHSLPDRLFLSLSLIGFQKNFSIPILKKHLFDCAILSLIESKRLYACFTTNGMRQRYSALQEVVF